MTKVLGIIGGSGIYEISDIEHGQWINIESPFGSPLDEFADLSPSIELPETRFFD